MMSEKHAPSEPLVLTETLDLKAAAPLVSQFLERRGSELTVDGSKVRRLGGQCLQVLLSAKATWEADEISLEFVNPSEDLLAAIEGFGFPADKLMDQEFSL